MQSRENMNQRTGLHTLHSHVQYMLSIFIRICITQKLISLAVFRLTIATFLFPHLKSQHRTFFKLPN